MNYYYLVLMVKLKCFTGYLTTKLCSLYMNIGYIVTRGTNKEVDRILINKEKKIDKVKKDVILAANRVLELQTQVESVKTKEEAKAEVKLFKLQKRVNTI